MLKLSGKFLAEIFFIYFMYVHIFSLFSYFHFNMEHME